MPKATHAERIQRRIQTTAAGCWEWTAYRNRLGYGMATVDGKHGVLVHRWAYETFIGPIPEGLDVL